MALMDMIKVKVLKSVPVTANDLGTAVRDLLAGTDDEVPASVFDDLKAAGYVQALPEAPPDDGKLKLSGLNKTQLIDLAEARKLPVSKDNTVAQIQAALELHEKLAPMTDDELRAAATEAKVEVAADAGRDVLLLALLTPVAPAS